MNLKNASLAALAGTVLLAAAPAYADRGDRHYKQASQFHTRTVVVHKRAPHQAQRRVVVHRPVIVRHQPTVVYRAQSSHDVLGGLIVGAVLGAIIVSHAGR